MKAAIFDMDGTLLDSMGMWRSLTPAFIEKFDIDWSPERQKELIGLSFTGVAEYFCRNYPELGYVPESLIKLWADMLTEGYRTIVTIKPGVVQYLEKLKREGIPCAVATMTEHFISDNALDLHRLSGYMSHKLTHEDVGMVGKERPDLFLEAARRLGYGPGDCVVFEDSFFAAKAAREAGFTVIGVDDRVQDDAKRLKSVCHRYITDFTELL